MRFILSLTMLISVLIAGCNSPGCLIENKVTDTGASFVSSTLECSNPDAVKADLVKVVEALAPGLCKENNVPKGPLADTFCPIVANATVDFVVLNGVPASWGCKSTNVRLLAKDKLTELCKRLPVSEN
jgi:hypothetical protein